MMINDTTIDLTKESLGTIIFVAAFGKMFGKMVSAALVDSYNPKATYIISVFLKNVGLALFILSKNYYALMVWWSFQDTIWAPVWSISVKIVGNWFGGDTVGEAMGVLSLAWLFGDAICRGILGILIITKLNWRIIYMICIISSLSFLFLVFLFVKNGPNDMRWTLNFSFLKNANKVMGEDKFDPEIQKRVSVNLLSKNLEDPHEPDIVDHKIHIDPVDIGLNLVGIDVGKNDPEKNSLQEDNNVEKKNEVIINPNINGVKTSFCNVASQIYFVFLGEHLFG
eukprot:TRINITY_DN11587_c0_g1_i1.p1 TRINITY_DN11587_c0_g1~~TRINITY_DN11587_c0_g1_i1.p1  ORF type:complete len:282 (-),score=57.63 TRINITY_DN11587_c0_g1_i1:479-1324(-)